MSRPNLQRLAEGLMALYGTPSIDGDSWKVIEEAAAALIICQREIDYLSGQRDGAQRASNMAIRRLTNVLGCLWPDPMIGPTGQTYDGTPEMKVLCHDRARAVAKMEIKEEPYDHL